MDIIELSQDVSMVEMEVKQQWIGKNLIELNLRKNIPLTWWRSSKEKCKYQYRSGSTSDTGYAADRYCQPGKIE